MTKYTLIILKFQPLDTLMIIFLKYDFFRSYLQVTTFPKRIFQDCRGINLQVTRTIDLHLSMKQVEN